MRVCMYVCGSSRWRRNAMCVCVCVSVCYIGNVMYSFETAEWLLLLLCDYEGKRQDVDGDECTVA